MQKLSQSRGLKIEPVDLGIYYMNGDFFPIQIIVTSQLSEYNNFWLRNLTNDLQDESAPEMLFRKYQPKQHNILYKSVMNVIIRANNELFRREKPMCEALMELMQEEMDALRAQCIAEGLAEGLQKGITEGIAEGKRALIQKKLVKGKSIEEIADALEESIETVEELIRNL